MLAFRVNLFPAFTLYSTAENSMAGVPTSSRRHHPNRTGEKMLKSLTGTGFAFSIKLSFFSWRVMSFVSVVFVSREFFQRQFKQPESSPL
jgi:uncharacterized membrane protein